MHMMGNLHPIPKRRVQHHIQSVTMKTIAIISCLCTFTILYIHIESMHIQMSMCPHDKKDSNNIIIHEL